ncbi:MAG: hypothetical protein FRX48_09762 [Lasallia pustulata]|uniref:Uncharacterized protein n=1 Tax=Lasallia pustulata TaxID=136370 RepID=A0A5M8PB58_9LECA|nr:MAG: hypothetical protein FRX48_09762 [Lasallia pustulata]
MIIFITKNYEDPNPSKSSGTLTDGPATRQGISAGTKPIRYTSDWVTNKLGFNKAVKTLSGCITNIQDHSSFPRGTAASNCAAMEAATVADPLLPKSTTTSPAETDPPTPAQIPGAFPPNTTKAPSKTSILSLRSNPSLSRSKEPIRTRDQPLGRISEDPETSADESIRRLSTPLYQPWTAAELSRGITFDLPLNPSVENNTGGPTNNMSSQLGSGAGAPAADNNSLSPAALAQIRELMSKMLNNLPMQQGPAGPARLPGEQGLPGLPTNLARPRSAQWKPHDIGIFWPNIPASYGTGDVIDDGKEQYYRNVHSFIVRIRVAVLTRDTAMMRQNLDLCLKGEAQDWWTKQLAHVTRVGIMSDNTGMEEWIKALGK